MSEELKPCPFCGTPVSGTWCHYGECGTVVFRDAEQWNRRPIEDALATELEKLRAQVEELTADRDSEQRWANQYKAERDATRAEVERLREVLQQVDSIATRIQRWQRQNIEAMWYEDWQEVVTNARAALEVK